jgi:hypothetical protein
MADIENGSTSEWLDYLISPPFFRVSVNCRLLEQKVVGGDAQRFAEPESAIDEY